jgi:hypothetical protein
MSNRLSGKVCIITGTGGGIGREAALTFAREGALVVGCGLYADEGKATVAAVSAAGGTMVSMQPCSPGQKRPAELYQPSTRPYKGLPDIDYLFHDRIIVVTRCGRICLGSKKINFSTVFAGQAVGIKEVHDGIWLVSFMDYDLGYFDLDTRVLEPLENPFGPKLLPM